MLAPLAFFLRRIAALITSPSSNEVHTPARPVSAHRSPNLPWLISPGSMFTWDLDLPSLSGAFRCVYMSGCNWLQIAPIFLMDPGKSTQKVAGQTPRAVYTISIQMANLWRDKSEVWWSRKQKLGDNYTGAFWRASTCSTEDLIINRWI